MSLVIQGVNVYLTDCGSGSPILFLHGAPDSAEMWRSVIEHLKAQHRCFAPDLPGFGRSLAPADFNLKPGVPCNNLMKRCPTMPVAPSTATGIRFCKLVIVLLSERLRALFHAPRGASVE